ncbi:membrane fusion protein, multidrug efflux system [Mucilaginibacter lappiensis]|uniref:Membrane fusion protein (Multidrug efflux system) n=1 Tax=Mucilaginibacter lappiensis TaxID=354630 RepID=A0ABR6PHE8_9SPHI|nr:efflux RND transporter periplasmic adaptor subunit [Mucilaginibacter lappiensis]MBB6109189.1 membrane fusion protein (multidrug efflux system) [Mucilaginibacter lappiensis]SIQ79285.1 membrane fusion protein, multidrug efflux system [Mucilaginibacter lappiensis]
MKRVFLNAIFISLIILAACNKKQPPVNSEIPVNLFKVKEKHVLYYDQYPSTTAALSQVTLLPQVQGAVTGIFFTEGTHVKKGQKLYEIDRRIYQDSYDAAVANRKVTEGTLVQSQQDADRYEYLNKYNAVAKQLYDHAVITLQNSQSQVKSADQAVKTAKTNLNYATVYAPFDGTIGFSQVKLGNVVTSGSTILNTISTDDPMAVDFVINEKQLPRFELLQQNKHQTTDSLFTILLADNSLYPVNGKISVIDRAVNSQTGSITIRLVFPNPKGMLRVGMSCVVRVHNQEKGPQLLVPGKAVVEQMGEYFVYTAKDSLMNNPKAGADSAIKKVKKLVAVQKKVMVGQTIGPNMIIKSGINSGERIVVDGVQLLHDGARITTANKIAPSAGGKGGR